MLQPFTSAMLSCTGSIDQSILSCNCKYGVHGCVYHPVAVPLFLAHNCHIVYFEIVESSSAQFKFSWKSDKTVIMNKKML